MKNVTTTAALVGIALLWTTGAALAQAKPPAKVDFGALEYRSSCAVCHGLTGKGDGEYRALLTKSPTDLTMLAKRNGGVFPFEHVYEVIDGRQAVSAHGPRDMPIWGLGYNVELSSSFPELSSEGAEAFVRTRILALTEYINRLQVK
jgi:mono/diheme cytochrome c family protein